jgi:DNA primase
MRTSQLTFPEALRHLAERAHIPMPAWSPEERTRQARLGEEREVIKRIHLAAATFYHAQLTCEWEAWCFDKWGLKPETLQQFRIGFAPVSAQALWTHLKAHGFSTQDLRKSGLFVYVNGEFLDFYQGRIIFPYWIGLPIDGHGGEIVYFIGRHTEQTPDVAWEKGRKYKKLLTHSEKHPYVSEAVSNRYFYGEHCLCQAKGRDLLVMEGIADAAAALQAGIPCISPGTTSFRAADWSRLTRLAKHPRRLVIINDNEENQSGERGALKTAAHLFGQGIDARIGTLPRPEGVEKVDGADFLKAHSGEDLRRLMAEATLILDVYLERVRHAPEPDKAKAAEEVYPLVAHLSGVERNRAEKAIQRAFGGAKAIEIKVIREAIAAATQAKRHTPVAETQEPSTAVDPNSPAQEGRPEPQTSPYEVRNGCIVYVSQHPIYPTHTEAVRVADFTAHTAEEIVVEDGTRAFRLTGTTPPGHPFSVEIWAKEFADDRALKAALTQAAGAQFPVRAGMTKHLGPAIQLLTAPEIPRIRRYDRTGWANGHFLIPGREPSGVTIALLRKLPYAIHGEANLTIGLEAFGCLLSCMPTTQTTVAATIAFQAPLAPLAGWRDERHGLFIKGRTGSLKTSWTQVLMSLYGPEFLRDSLLIKLGQGATTNAIMAFATQASDLPLLIDNYKPSTGGGARDLINLLHNILEGGEKDRLNRAAELRETRPIFCWPIITGEDVPDTDAASLARILVVTFTWAPGTPNDELAQAQSQARHLYAVGATWLTWLESDEGQTRANSSPLSGRIGPRSSASSGPTWSISCAWPATWRAIS